MLPHTGSTGPPVVFVDRDAGRPMLVRIGRLTDRHVAVAININARCYISILDSVGDPQPFLWLCSWSQTLTGYTSWAKPARDCP